ncbi:MAG TPA: formate--tetrahydrofolate ligase [Candidatus Eisenbacteria bacterium]|nr:formate--tetrahydrofolate ligase [Candidatus Eisenbacteria bacterium]
MKPITDVARALGLDPAHLEPYGNWKAKIALAAFADRPRRGRLVLVSAITPTPAGEGKTTTSVGLAQGLARIGERSAVALREPSLGPSFGMKGGGAGGGASEVVPADDINMHFNGDFHAVSSAHNLLAALVDNHLHHGNAVGLDSRRVSWKRVVDMNDRALRDIVIGLGGRTEGIPRETGFDITAASEVMAILCLADGIPDLKARLARIVVGYRADGSPVTARDLEGVGAMAALLRDAVKPNLVQTTEGVPAFVHGGPFANIAHGTNSIAATRAALAYADYVITEAGFAFELGAEKFFDINCRYGDLAPACTVLVATIRALKMHGGVPLPDVNRPDVAGMERGFANLEKHLENIRKFEQTSVVAINHFPSDTPEEVAALQRHCEALGVRAVVAKPFSAGGPGCTDLAEVVREKARASTPAFRPLYDWGAPIEDKIRTIAREMYGAEAVDYTARAKRDRTQLEKLGFGRLPVCIAKTQQSLSDNPALLGRPKDFLVTVREIQLAAGAGFVIPITGEILRMPGLPREPLASRFDLSDAGEITFRR